MRKSYSLAAAQLAETGATPDFALWPNFYSEGWAHNLAVYAGPYAHDHPRFQAAPMFADGDSDIASLVNGLEKDVRVWECNRPPLGFALIDEAQPAGLVLRSSLLPPASIVSGNVWEIAVDFGTAKLRMFPIPRPNVQNLPFKFKAA